jgi:hypothetical protein
MESSRKAENLIDELLERIDSDRAAPSALEEWLLEFAAVDGTHRKAVGDAVGIAARQLAPDDAPPRGAERAVWEALVLAVDRLYGSGVEPLGRLPFIGDSLLGQLVGESLAQRPEEEGGDRRQVGAAGSVLAGLAVSRQLREAVGEALGLVLVPTYDAVYLYDPPRGHVRTHVDADDYEIVVHVVLEHTPPSGGSAGSALVVHEPGRPEPTRLLFAPGDAVVLRGRGTIHSWEALGADERRTLTAIGFEPAD